MKRPSENICLVREFGRRFPLYTRKHGRIKCRASLLELSVASCVVPEMLRMDKARILSKLSGLKPFDHAFCGGFDVGQVQQDSFNV